MHISLLKMVNEAKGVGGGQELPGVPVLGAVAPDGSSSAMQDDYHRIASLVR